MVVEKKKDDVSDTDLTIEKEKCRETRCINSLCNLPDELTIADIKEVTLEDR
jgi:hypothetical protein